MLIYYDYIYKNFNIFQKNLRHFYIIKNNIMFPVRYMTRIFKYSSLNTYSKYFDYQATTPLDYRVYDAMIPYLT